MPLLEIRDLRVEFGAGERTAHAVNGVSIAIDAGRALAIVGESGSGKSTLGYATVGLVPGQGRITGEVLFKGRDILAMSHGDARALRGSEIAMVVQSPMSAFDPVYKIGAQITEAIRAHTDVSRQAAGRQAVGLLGDVGIPHPELRAGQYPHEFSGGMSQRALIAMALSCKPSLLIADEPTSALDVTVQAQILEVLRAAREAYGLALLLITHDLRLPGTIADDVAVMYAGRIVERADVERALREPEHPYTVALLRSASIGIGERRRRLPGIAGAPPDPARLPTGCRFHPRCPHAMDICRAEDPPLIDDGTGHAVACHLPNERRRELAA
jgi:oligopeptide/dipeptide ABC transporter ATP-binding protein